MRSIPDDFYRQKSSSHHLLVLNIVVRKKTAMDLLGDIERQFATFRDK